MTHSSHVISDLATTLATHATEVFGLMGNGNAHLIDELIAKGCKYTSMRHEAGTIAAADAYTRVAGKLAIATTTYGAGFTNALTALAEATKARTPMIVVIGDEPSNGARVFDVDQEMLTVALGTRNYRVSSTGVSRTVSKAISFSLRVRKPVVISVPYDLVRGEIDGSGISETGTPRQSADNLVLDDASLLETLSRSVRGDDAAPAIQASQPAQIPTTLMSMVQSPSASEIEVAVKALGGAVRPMILAGRGVYLSGAKSELAKVADLLGAVTASTALARGIFSDEQYDLGVTGGFGAEGAMAIAAQADVVLVVGASLNQFTMRFGELIAAGATIVRVDIDEVQPPYTKGDAKHLLVRADASEGLELIAKGLRNAGYRSAGWREKVREQISVGNLLEHNNGRNENSSGLCPDGLLDPRQVAARIAELLPEDIYITQDGGHFIGWANMFWPISAPNRLVMVGTAYQTIGLGLATVAGVATAAPGSTVVLSMGDGGGLMGLADLETAIREAYSCLIVVWNDSAYGAEVHLYGEMGLDQEPMRISTVNFAEVATALGAEGKIVESIADLNAIEEWRVSGAKGTLLLDCRVSDSIVAPYQSEIQRFNGLVN